MTMTESNNNEIIQLKVHWFGDPEDDETTAEALKVCSYFHTGRDIRHLAEKAVEAKRRHRARSNTMHRALTQRSCPPQV